MDRVKITFPDGDVQEYQKGITPQQILEQINSQALAKKTVAARLNKRLIDLTRPIKEDGTLVFVSHDTPDGMEVFWHSSAHIMAHAIKKLYPEAKFGFGPALEDRFFYDFDIDKSLAPEDLEKIEQKMKEIVEQNTPFVREELSKEQAIKLFNMLDFIWFVSLFE